MEHGFKLKLDADEVRFSSDGRVALPDAIKAMTGCEPPQEVLDRMKMIFHEIPCGYVEWDFPGESSVPVVSGEGWSTLCDWLATHGCQSVGEQMA